jgi:hypothetical protein
MRRSGTGHVSDIPARHYAPVSCPRCLKVPGGFAVRRGKARAHKKIVHRRGRGQRRGAARSRLRQLVLGRVKRRKYCLLLLFGSAFSAYATAEALTSGTIPLTAIQIGSFLNGNVLAGQQNVGKALGLGMVLIIAVLMALYTLLQRRAARWLQ